jgi:hypothetical protein
MGCNSMLLGFTVTDLSCRGWIELTYMAGRQCPLIRVFPKDVPRLVPKSQTTIPGMNGHSYVGVAGD